MSDGEAKKYKGERIPYDDDVDAFSSEVQILEEALTKATGEEQRKNIEQQLGISRKRLAVAMHLNSPSLF